MICLMRHSQFDLLMPRLIPESEERLLKLVTASVLNATAIKLCVTEQKKVRFYYDMNKNSSRLTHMSLALILNI
jgi:hypothetical protein